MINRRNALKAVLAGCTMLSLGALIPRISLAAWNEKAFSAADQDTAIDALYDGIPDASANIK